MNKGQWSRLPPEKPGRYWFAVARGVLERRLQSSDVSLIEQPYAVGVTEVYVVEGILHENQIAGMSFEMTSWNKRDVWWWTEPLHEPTPPTPEMKKWMPTGYVCKTCGELAYDDLTKLDICINGHRHPVGNGTDRRISRKTWERRQNRKKG